MSFIKALMLSLLVHGIVLVVFLIRLPSIEVTSRPDTYFLGGILSLHDVMPTSTMSSDSKKIIEHLPEWQSDITFRRWLHQQKVHKNVVNAIFKEDKNQYKSGFHEFKIELDYNENDDVDIDKELDFIFPEREPLKLQE